MKLSTRTRYGLRAILELAEYEGQGPLQLKKIAEKQDISVKYLEQLIAVLKSSGLVRSIRGARGGYMLARSADEIKLSECFVALEGHVVTAECVEEESACGRAAECAARYAWAKVQRAVMDVLESMTLKDLIERGHDKKNLNYQI